MHFNPNTVSNLTEWRVFSLRLLKKLNKKFKTVGLSLSVVDAQRTLLQTGLGYQDKNRRLPAGENTVYRAGSISKVFTAMAVMQLAEQGKLELDLPLKYYLPDFTIKNRFDSHTPITPRLLLTHHAGLPCDIFHRIWCDESHCLAELPAGIAREYMAYPPDTVFSYSNMGFNLLGILVEKISGLAFADYAKQHLLQAMHMNDSSFRLDAGLRPRFAQGYLNRKPVDEPHLRDIPAGALYTTAEDMAVFAKCLFAVLENLTHSPLSFTSLQSMLSVQNKHHYLDFDVKNGLGWFLHGSEQFHGSGPVAFHDGGTVAHRSLMLMLPRHRLAVTLLSNSAEAGFVIYEAANRILQALLKLKTGEHQPLPNQKTTKSKRLPAPQRDVTALPGCYATEFGTAWINAHKRKLTAEVAGFRLQLYYTEHRTYRLKYKLLGLLPLPSPWEQWQLVFDEYEGKTLVLAESDGVRSLAGVKLQPYTVGDAWKKRLGTYRWVNRDEKSLQIAGFALSEHNGFLFLSFDLTFPATQKVSVPLDIISDSLAVTAGIGRRSQQAVEAVMEADGEILTFSGLMMKRQGNSAPPASTSPK